MTPGDLIAIALKTAGVIGIGQTADYQDTSDVFVILNAMIGQWSRKRFLIPNLVDVATTSTGAQSYTIGPGGTFNVPRPDRIEAAYCRLLPVLSTGSVDFPLDIIDAHEDYADLVLKELVSFPMALFYDSAWPLGNLFFYPVPNAQFELHVVIKNTIAQFAGLTTVINLPPEYTDALIWNLACRIRPLYQLAPDPSLVALAATALNTIRGANAQIPRLRMPSGLPSGRGRWPGHGITGYGSIE
jgi:P22 tail accessory factor